jgi:group I intron endonuclease
MNSGIYAIINKINGHKYIGSSADITNRWKRHIKRLENNDHHSRHLQNAWNKYGKDNFEFAVLIECPVGDLLDHEQEQIDSGRPEYNVSPTAGRTAGVIRSAEYRRKQSESQRGKRLSAETRQKISDGMKGKKNSLGVIRVVSEETRKKISRSLMGHPVSEESRRKSSEKNTGRHHTEEAKRKIGLAALGNKHAARGD